MTLDRNFNITPLTQALVTPVRNVEINSKVDRQLNVNHTLAVRYTFARDASDNQGVGGFSLPERGLQRTRFGRHDQFIETGVLIPHCE